MHNLYDADPESHDLPYPSQIYLQYLKSGPYWQAEAHQFLLRQRRLPVPIVGVPIARNQTRNPQEI